MGASVEFPLLLPVPKDDTTQWLQSDAVIYSLSLSRAATRLPCAYFCAAFYCPRTCLSRDTFILGHLVEEIAKTITSAAWVATLCNPGSHTSPPFQKTDRRGLGLLSEGLLVPGLVDEQHLSSSPARTSWGRLPLESGSWNGGCRFSGRSVA